MSRIRTIKPEFFDDPKMADVSPLARLAFIGLWTCVDRRGLVEYEPRRLKVKILPFDAVDFSALLDELESVGVVTRYTVEGRNLLCVNRFESHQRPHPKEPESTLVGPAVERNGEPRKSDDEPARKGREGKGTGKEQEGEWRVRFDLFWEKYPRKVGKDAAWAEWKRLKPDASLLELMLSAVLLQSQSRQWRENDGEFIPHPRTWLRQGRWQDEPGKTGTGKARGNWTAWECPHEPECESRSKCADADILGKARKAVTA